MTILEQAISARRGALDIQGYNEEDKNKILSSISIFLKNNKDSILKANKIDLDNFPDKTSALYDRLTLNDKRVDAMVEGVQEVIALPDPVGEVTGEWTRPSGITIKKARAPLGVIAIIYEARPNVTVDAAILCIKSGNAVVLRGSKGAINSNREIYRLMREAIIDAGYNPDIVQFIDDISHDGVKELLGCDKWVDLVIPRGGEGLKHFVLDNSKIPVLASAGGNDHIYVGKSADFDLSIDVIENAKCQKPSTCNAVEHIIINKDIKDTFIPKLCARLRACGVKVLGDEASVKVDKNIIPATKEDFDTEFLALTLTIEVVDNVMDAINIINSRGTRHSEGILTSDKEEADLFTTLVDAAATYVNTSTRFTDGFEFGFGAEMGISTCKMHARGPIGLTQLTTERYIINSNYCIRK